MRLSRLGMFFLCVCFLVVFSVEAQPKRIAYNMKVYPENVVVKAGQSVKFTTLVEGRRGTVYTPTGVTWYANGGTINTRGRFVAGGNPGYYTVTARVGRYVGVARVQVKTFAPKVQRVVITPRNPRVIVGRGIQFKAIAYDQLNRPVPFRPVWTAVGGGTINAAGYYQANTPGTYAVTVKVRRGRAFDTTRVYITRPLPNLSRLVITPSNTRILVGQRVQFTVAAYDSYGRPIACRPIWATNAGTINRRGILSAGYRPGHYKVWVKDAVTGQKAAANVKLVRNNIPVPPPVSNARIVVSNVKIKHIFFKKSRASMKVQVFGRRAATLKLYGIRSGRMDELDARSCRNGDTMNITVRYSPMTSNFELRLYDGMGRVIARHKRSAR